MWFKFKVPICQENSDNLKALRAKAAPDEVLNKLSKSDSFCLKSDGECVSCSESL